MNKEFWKAAGIRAVKTFAQSALSLISVGQAVTDIDWKGVVGISITAAIISILTSVTGIGGKLPEVTYNQKSDDSEDEE